MRSLLFKILLYIQVFVGMSAIGGGLPMVLKPFEMNTQTLDGSPFSSFLIPGLLLLFIHGVGSILGAYFSYHKKWPGEIIAIVLGTALVIWMVVQILLLGVNGWFQPLFLFLGITELGLGIFLIVKR